MKTFVFEYPSVIYPGKMSYQGNIEATDEAEALEKFKAAWPRHFNKPFPTEGKVKEGRVEVIFIPA